MVKISEDMAAVVGFEKELAIANPPSTDIEIERKRRIALSRYWSVGAPFLDMVRDISITVEGQIAKFRIYHPDAGVSLPIILLIHGGGWAFGSIQEVEPIARHLAFQTRSVVVSIDYRLAPEHPYPAGLNDCRTVLDWLVHEGDKIGGDPTRIAICGESAGGNLAAALALQYRHGSLKALALFYGVLQQSFETESYRNLGDGRFGLSRGRMMAAFDQYVPQNVERSQPGISPMLGDLGTLPPTWLCAAECDPLRDDTMMFAERLRRIRAIDECIVVPGVTHMFAQKVRLLPSAELAIGKASQFLSRYLQS